MKKSTKKYYKISIYFLFLTLILICWPEPAGQVGNISMPGYIAIVKHYNQVKQEETSELNDLLIKIVEDRLQCYSEVSDYTLRLQKCRKEYTYNILRTAREQIKSAPSVGYFMRCIQECPITFSICSGEDNYSIDDRDCVEMEVLCIESCLDKFWRGTSLRSAGE